MMAMMNDSISISSSSAGSSQSNSLNRSSTNSSNSSNSTAMKTTMTTTTMTTNNEPVMVVVGSASSSSALGVSLSSSSGASPVLPVRHRLRNPHRRPRAKSQTMMMTNRGGSGGELFDEPSCSSSSASSTRPVSLNTDVVVNNGGGGGGANSLLEHNRQLMEDLFELKRQLKQRDQEVERLVDVRNRLESEMQDLSASLFEQAYLMVNSARAEAAQSEKLLKEANGKIDVLQAEVKALKELVALNTSNSSTPNQKSRLKPFTSSTSSSSHARQSSLNHQTLTQLIIVPPTSTSTPSSNHNHLTQQIVAAQSTNSLGGGDASKQSMTSSASTVTLKHSTSSVQPLSLSAGKEKPPLASTESGKHHRRLPSDQAKSFIDKLFHHSSSSSLNSSSASHKSSSSSSNDKRLSRDMKYESLDRTCSIDGNIYEQEAVEHDMTYYDELVEWRQKPELTASSSPFLTRIYAEDIIPCLHFNSSKPCDELLAAILENHVCIEDISNQSSDNNSMNKVCGLSNVPGVCQYKIKLTENGQWIYISRLTRNRIISVCDFFTYLRYIKDGLVKSDVNEIYWYIIDLRRKMALSRLGL